MVAAPPLRGGPLPDREFPISIVEQLVEHITNEDEQLVLDSMYVAFYKGTPVILVPGSSSFSFGIIIMGKDGDSDLLRHEYGHTKQLQKLGIIDYSTYVVMPSVICYWLTEAKLLSWDYYFSYPWEYEADQYGEASHEYQTWAERAAEIYTKLVDFFT